MKRFRLAVALGAAVFYCAALGGGSVSAQSVTYQFSRTASDWSARSISRAGSDISQHGGTNTNTKTGGPSATGATAASSTVFPINETNFAVSGNSVAIGPNADGQNVLQVSGLLMSQLEVVNKPSNIAYQRWADGTMEAPAPAPNAAANSVTATVNTTPSGQNGTALLKIDLLWLIHHSNPTASWSQTGFMVRIYQGSQSLTPALEAIGAGLESGFVFVANDETYGTDYLLVDPTGGGLTLTRTITNVQDRETFTIVVRPFAANDGVDAGESGLVDISLAVGASVTMTN